MYYPYNYRSFDYFEKLELPVSKWYIPALNSKFLPCKLCRIALQYLFLRKKVKVNVFFSFLGFPDNVQYVSACKLQNTAHLHYIDLYGNIF